MNLLTCRKSVAALLFLLSSNLFAQSPTITPVPAWVKPVVAELNAKANDASATGGTYYLLLDQQEQIERQEVYGHYAYVLLTSEGVQQMSSVAVSFDPAYQKLSFHKVVVHRDGESISQLIASDIKTIQREESMDRYMYDGTVTSIINLKDVRVGDVIEYSYSIKGYNPVFNGHYSQKINFDYAQPLAHVYNRLVVPPGKNLAFEYRNGEVKPTVSTLGNSTEYVWSVKDVKAIIADNNQPAWYDPYRHVMVTDFKNWGEVNTWAVKHFEVPASEKAQLRARIQGKFTSAGKEELVMEAVRFVQDQVRYLGFEAGLNSHKPHAPVQVFDQLYGDCKDKSLLLSSILQLNGIESYPVLVNTAYRDHVSDLAPSQLAFNHCITQIVHDGRIFYIDPTVSNQGGSLQNNYFPRYGKGLVIREGGSDLISLAETGHAEITEEQTFEMNTVGGEAFLNIKTTYSGAEADIIRGQLANTSLNEIQKFYLNYYGNMYPDLKEEEPIMVTDDRQSNMVVIEEKYRISTFWKPLEGKENNIFCSLYPLAIDNLVNISKSTARKAPYQLNYPGSYHHYTRVRLPEDWTIEEANVNVDAAYYQYRHSIMYDDRLLTIYHHYKTLTDHVPLEAIAKFSDDHEAIMRNLSYSLTYDKSLQNIEGISWVAVILTFITLGAGIFMVIKLYRFDPKPALDGSDGEQIGGWLFLVAIGVIISPFRLVWDFLVSNEFFANQTWIGLWKLQRWGLLSVISFELVYNVLAILFSILIMALFFQRRSSLPRLITIYYAVTVSVGTLDMILVKFVLNTEGDFSYKGLIQSMVAAAIWIPYFNLSQRVNETFVERLNDDAPAEPQPQQTNNEVMPLS